MMFPNLKAEMARGGITSGALAKMLNVSESTISMKLNKPDRIKLKECVEIRDAFFPEKDIGYLFDFQSDDQRAS